MKIFLVFVFFFLPLSVFAQSIVINEIAWMGTSVAGVEESQWWRYEWIELYNAGDTVGMLDDWTVELSREKIDFKIPLSGTISTGGYFLVGASEKIPNLDLNYKNLGGKFNNSGQKVVLKNNVGEIVDEIDATKGLPADEAGWPAGDNKTKQTMERRAGSDPTTLWQTSKEPGGTPGASNSEGIAKDQTKPGLVKDETEKDLMGSSSDSKLSLTKDVQVLQSFQGRVPVVNPITLLAGLLALGFSGVLLLVKRSLALRQRSRQVSRQEHQKV